MTDPSISAADRHDRRRVAVLDSEMAYVDTGRGRPVGRLDLQGGLVWPPPWDRLAGARAEALPVKATTGRRGAGAAEERVRRAHPARQYHAQAERGRDGRLPGAFPRAG